MGDDGQRDDVGMGLVKYLFFRGLIRPRRRSTVHAPAGRVP